MKNKLIVRQLGLKPYQEVYQAMHTFTASRTFENADEVWLTEHPPIFTQGKVGKPEHLLVSQEHIPVFQSDRGGQITYHGPGQLIFYTLINLKRRQLSIREMVNCLENSVITTLAQLNIEAVAKPDAPGVYVNNQKICSLGLHIQRGCTLHGLALNVDMDLSPFNLINPCGYSDLTMTQVSQLSSTFCYTDLSLQLVTAFAKQLHYDAINYY
jgi:lipoyl(octanoyl) transferase